MNTSTIGKLVIKMIVVQVETKTVVMYSLVAEGGGINLVV